VQYMRAVRPNSDFQSVELLDLSSSPEIIDESSCILGVTKY